MKKIDNSEMFSFNADGSRTTFGQAKQRLVAGIYNAAKRKPIFTARDVWAEIADPRFRAICAESRLLSVAFRIALRPKTAIVRKVNLGYTPGDRTCHLRPQRLWASALSA